VKRETQRHRDAFEVWYASDRGWSVVTERFHVSLTAARQWAEAFDWRGRADARDQEAFKKAERDAINRRAKKLKEHQQLGELMRRRATEHFAKREIVETGDAIRAAKEGIAIERAAEGLPTEILELLTYDSDALYAERERLLRRLQAADGAEADREAGAAAVDSSSEGDELEDREVRPANALWGSGEPEAGPVPEPEV
jgi:hypothetical protein